MNLKMFHLDGCPYCRQAFAWLDELYAENPRYASVEIEKIEERRESAVADTYDYYYVPCFFLDGKKLHEGAATKEKLRAVLDACLTA